MSANRISSVAACAAAMSIASCARHQDIASAPRTTAADAAAGDAAADATPPAVIDSRAVGAGAGVGVSVDAAVANDDPCDEWVADARKNGPYGLVKIEGPLRDPFCKWRFDDANGGGDEAMMARFSEPGSTNTVVSLGSSGMRPSRTIVPTMRALRPAIRKCLEGEKLGPAIRLRVTITPAGAVDGVVFDYRVTTEEHARDCVAFALQHQKFPAHADAGADSTTFTLAFSLRK